MPDSAWEMLWRGDMQWPGGSAWKSQGTGGPGGRPPNGCRSSTEAEVIKNEFGRELVYRVTGQQDVVAAWPAAKILWLRNHELGVFNATDKFLMVEDYLIYRLTRGAGEKPPRGRPKQNRLVY